jgi:hypothetical protein
VPLFRLALGENQGLLVARLYVPGTLAWESARVNIDGRLYSASVRDGYIGIAQKALNWPQRLTDRTTNSLAHSNGSMCPSLRPVGGLAEHSAETIDNPGRKP